MLWKTCPNWPEYEISECGDIRRIVRRNGFCGIRKPYIAANGRLMIVMRDPQKRPRACHVSRLVAEAFHGVAPTPAHEAAHNDGNPLNNHYTNLRWASRSENQMDRVLHGTSNRGERFARSRLTRRQVLEIRERLQLGESSYQLAPKFGVAASTIRAIASRRSWYWLEDASVLLGYALESENES